MRGRKVIIKSIPQTIPTCTMSCFILPLKTCDEINKLCACSLVGVFRGEVEVPLEKLEEMGEIGFCVAP